MGLQLKVVVSDQVSFVALDEPLAVIPAKTSAIYTLVDSNGEPVIEDLVLKRKGSDLEIEVDGEPVASIGDFYATEGPVIYSVEGALNPAEELAVQGGPSAVDDGIVWQASATDTQGFGMGAVLLGAGAAGAAAFAVGAYNDDGSEPDTTAPATSTRVVVTDDQGSVTGALNSGDSTDDTAVVLSGSNEPGSTVQIYDGTEYLGEAVVDGTSWSYNAPIDDGTTYQFNTKETDTAGNESAATSNFEVTGDTAAPATSTRVVVTDDQGSVTGPLNSGDSTDDTAVVLSGTNEPGSTVQVYDGTEYLGEAVVGVTSWSYNAPIDDGKTYQFNTKETDTAGNESDPTSNFEVTGDTAAPATSSMVVVTDNQGSVTGALNSGDSTDDTAVVLSGSNEPGSTVQVYDGTEYLGEAVVDGTSWSYNAPIDDGQTYQFNTTETDTAGNESAATSNFEVTGDTAAPATSSRVVVTDDQGSVTGPLNSGDSTDDTAVVLSGSNEPGATVQVYDGTEYLGEAVVDGTSWSYTASIDDGTTYQFNTKETDTAGNESDATSNFEVAGDTTAPTVPTVTQQSTSDTTPVISGTATLVGAETLSVTVNGATYNEVAVTAAGDWSINTQITTPDSGAINAFIDGNSYEVI
ncbi:MAG: hypothetical protein ACJAWL_001705, partial [Motiliproteus sp.]